MMARLSISERIAKHSTGAASGCIVWTGAHHQRGYGVITVGGKSLRSHRVTWEMAHGPIPDGMVVCHRCDNPPCINVEHLFLGTQADNIHDLWAKGRGHDRNRTHCINGHEFTPENTYIRKPTPRTPRKTGRMCRACHAARANARRAARSAA